LAGLEYQALAPDLDDGGHVEPGQGEFDFGLRPGGTDAKSEPAFCRFSIGRMASDRRDPIEKALAAYFDLLDLKLAKNRNIDVYRLKFLGRALDDLSRIHKPQHKIIKEKLLGLAENPEALKNNITRLIATEERLFRLNVGSYRIIFLKEEKELLIVVVRIGHRTEIYHSF
jgi:mRNA interferase RelE/StbE